jgi:hypothetical protein
MLTDQETERGLRAKTTIRCWSQGLPWAASALGALVAVLCASLLVAVAPALATTTERGHTFGFSLGEAGSGNNQFEEPVALAVSEATGELYVVDHKLKRVDRYQCPVTQEELEKSPSCSFIGDFPVSGGPVAVAVDNSGAAGDPSAGDVYVAAGRKVFKFTGEGKPEGEIKEFVPGEKLEGEKVLGVAVDAEGNLWVDWGEEGVSTFNDEKVNGLIDHFEVSLPAGILRSGFAVDSEQHIYAGYEPAESEVGKHCTHSPCSVAKLETPQSVALEHLEESEIGETVLPSFDSQNSTGVAVDILGGDEVYVDNQTSVAVFTAAGGLLQRFGEGHLKGGAGLAVDARSGAVFVGDLEQTDVQVFVPTPPHEPVVTGEGVSDLNAEAGSAKLEATVNPFGAETEYDFEYGTSEHYEHTAPVPPAVLSSTGFEAQTASVGVSGLASGTTYHFRVVAKNKFGTVDGPDHTFKLILSSAQTGLPDGRQWELVSPGLKFGASILAVGGETTSQGVIRSAAAGGAISYTADAPTDRNPQGSRGPERSQLLSTRGPDGWTSEEITPADHVKGQFTGPGEPPQYRMFSEDLSLGLLVPLHGRSSSLLAEPPLSPPVEFEVGGKLTKEAEGEQEKTIYLRQNAPVTPSGPEAELEQTSYEEAAKNATEEAKLHPETEGESGFLALLTGADVPGGTHFGGLSTETGEAAVLFLNASPGLAHVVLSSAVPLAAAPSTAGLYEWSALGPKRVGESGEDREKERRAQLQQVSILPDNLPDKESPRDLRLGARFNSRNAISTNGSMVVWEGGDEARETHLFVRDLAKQQTLELGQPIVGEPLSNPVTGPVFQMASRDGSKIFFTDEQKLVAGSGAGHDKPELYVCEVFEETSGKLGCHVTDLSMVHSGESGEAQGTVLGITETGGCEAGSKEGCNVYFVANGALTPEATRGECSGVETLAGRTCNLYVRRFNGTVWEAPVLIAALASTDLPDWESLQGGTRQVFNPGHITSRVSPNGQYLAFMSMRELTAYDNLDANSGERDEEVYLYNAEKNHVICASCNPDGTRPEGLRDTKRATEEAEEGAVPLVDSSEIWINISENLPEPIYLAGNVPGWNPISTSFALQQSRYLNDEGRLFFDASGKLVPQATNGKENVYEYEPEGIGSCTSASDTFAQQDGGCVALISSGKSPRESAFIEASEHGGDVYFLTAEALSKADTDTNYDLYDAHECTEGSPCPPPAAEPPPPCNGESSCKEPAPSLTAEAQGSATSSGPGNLAAPQSGVLPSTVNKPPAPQPKPLTRAQKLAKALKACKKVRNKRTRASCEKQARKKYGTKLNGGKKR